MAAGAPYTLSGGGHSHSWCSLKTCLLSVSNLVMGWKRTRVMPSQGPGPEWGGVPPSPALELRRGSGKSVPGPFPPKLEEELGQDSLGPTLAAGTAHPQSQSWPGERSGLRFQSCPKAQPGMPVSLTCPHAACPAWGSSSTWFHTPALTSPWQPGPR